MKIIYLTLLLFFLLLISYLLTKKNPLKLNLKSNRSNSFNCSWTKLSKLTKKCFQCQEVITKDGCSCCIQHRETQLNGFCPSQFHGSETHHRHHLHFFPPSFEKIKFSLTLLLFLLLVIKFIKKLKEKLKRRKLTT